MTETAQTTSVAEAVRFLAGRCDWAYTRDNSGFSQADAGLGHFLAGLAEDQWTPDQMGEAYNLTRKYRRQLEEAGFELEAMPVPERAGATDVRQRAQEDRVAQKKGQLTVENGVVTRREDRGLEIKGDEFILRFPYDAAMVDAARNISGRRYNGSDKTNRYPATPAAAAGLQAFMARYEGFQVDPLAASTLEELAGEHEATEPPAWGSLTVEDDKFLVGFPYERDVVGAMQRVAGRRWDAGRKLNTVPITPTSGEQLATFLTEHRDRGWDVSEGAKQALRDCVRQAKEARAEAERLKKVSIAEDAEIEVEGLGGELRPFQRAGVNYALRTRRTFIADDMGTGKTVQALAAVLAADAFPVVVVCPQSMKLAWRDHVRGPTPGAPDGWLPGRKVRVLSGRKPQPRLLNGADVAVINYDVLEGWLSALKAFRPKTLILDESHYVKSSKAKRTKATKALAKRVPRDGLVMMLTGTAIKNRPIEYASQLEILGRLEEFGGYMAYAKRYCAAFHDGYGWNMSGASNLPELNERLRGSCYIRRRKADIMKELPPKQIATVPVDLSNRAEYLRVEHDVIAWLRDQVTRDEEFMGEIADLPEEERKQRVRERRAEVEAKAARAERLVQVNKLRMVSGLGKIKAATEWVEDFLESNEEEKLVVFAEHIEVQKALLSALRKRNPARLLGEDSAEARNSEVKRFQEDERCRVIVCSLKAGGIGITLTAASNVVFIEQGWTPADMDQAEDRCHRIGQEDQVTAWYLIAEDSFDKDMAALIAEKRAVVTAATDGREDIGRVSVMGEAIERLLRRSREREND